jgi:hypothetical protein
MTGNIHRGAWPLTVILAALPVMAQTPSPAPNNSPSAVYLIESGASTSAPNTQLSEQSQFVATLLELRLDASNSLLIKRAQAASRC